MENKTECYNSKEEFIADVKSQVINIFYDNLRGFLKAMELNFDRMDDKHPMVKPIKTVVAADKIGKLEEHISFDGKSVTHMSSDGETVMALFANFQEHLNKQQYEE